MSTVRQIMVLFDVAMWVDGYPIRHEWKFAFIPIALWWCLASPQKLVGEVKVVDGTIMELWINVRLAV